MRLSPRWTRLPVEVDDEVAMADEATAGGVREIPVRAAQERLDAAEQLPQAVRLGHVVIGAHLQPDDLVHLLVTRGQHQDGCLGAVGAQTAQRLEAIDAGHAHVQHHEVRGQLAGHAQGLLTAAGHADLVALLFQGVLDAAGHGVLVVDDEDGC